ncbi:MAG: VOC family protein [Ignavibacteriaceae bacterium]|jgi:predicted enzyme related to lactoylglutathione lyase
MLQPLIAHVEIPSTDLEKSKNFYKEVFEWEFKPFGNGYLLFNNHQGIMAGLRQVENIATGDTTVFHINVESIDDILRKVTEFGGNIKTEKITIPVMGWYALIHDTEGNTIGLYQKS